MLESGTYYLFCYNRTNNDEIDLLTAADGESFSLNSTVLTPSASGWDAGAVADPSIETDGSTYYLYYTGLDGNDDFAGIGVATASDITGPYSKSPSNPILTAGTGWESDRVSEPHVRLQNGTFYMTYSGDDGSAQAIGLATSSDGESFAKEATNPVWDPGDVNDQCHIYADGEWHLYATSEQGGSAYGGAILKTTSSDITSFDGNHEPILQTPDSDYSPAIRYDSDAGEYKMYWAPQDGGGTVRIKLATANVLYLDS